MLQPQHFIILLLFSGRDFILFHLQFLSQINYCRHSLCPEIIADYLLQIFMLSQICILDR